MERGRAATRPWGAGTRECLCMFARVFVCVHAYMCACMYSCACLRACWCTHVYVRVCVHAYVCVHACVRGSARSYRAGVLPCDQGVTSGMGCQRRGQAGAQTDRQTLGAGREQTPAPSKG